ncbi:uncharacterized protein LOC131880311 [Tigriopus californicus]|uniref:uncharacterized protein LOC131880311 n=1 Tax=Tigriopus californicus TaxID=6832 RepID=UPI0027DA4E14|nr:uncharacterized protein LOC131880311 [Tigriopus californicus]
MLISVEPSCPNTISKPSRSNTFRYTCDEGFAFPDETNEKTLTCGTDGQWTPSEPGDCSRVACDGEPPIPMASLNLIRQDWKSGKFAKFGTSVSYQCKPHTQVAEGITHFNLTCTDDQDKGVFIGEYYNSTLTQPFGACLEVATCPPPDAIENTVQKRNPYFSEWSNPGYWRATYSEAPNIISSPAFAIDGKIDPQNPEVMPFAANGSGFLTIDLVENFIIEKVRLHFKESSTSKMLQVAVSVSSHSNQPCGSTGDKAPSSMHEFVCNIPYIGSKLGIVKSSSGPLAIDEILVIGTRFSVPMDSTQLSVQPENAPKEKQFKLILGDEGSPHVVYGVGFTLAKDQATSQESEFPSVEVTITNQAGAKCQSTTHPGFAGEQLVVCDDSVEATELTIALETSDSILTTNFFVRLVGWKDEARGFDTCYEMFSKGLTAPGWYFLGRSNEKRSYAFCSDGQTRILRRLQSGNDKDVFNKEFEAYQSGFKENEEYFIGTDFMYRSSTWYTVVASIRMKDTFGREKRINLVCSTSRNFAIWIHQQWSIGVFRIMDVLSMHNGIPLATIDQPDADGCVASLNAPGWFRNDSSRCAYANLFGTNLNSHEAEAGKGIFFSSFRGFSNSLAELEFSVFSGITSNQFSPSTQAIMTTFKTEVEYHCPDGMSFTDDSGSDITPKLTLTCQWSGNYSRSHEGDLKCAYTHCTDPPIDDQNLVTTNWDGQKVPVGGVVQYRCIDGMKFNHNRSLEYVEITCQTGNKYSEVPTVECVHNITCPQLVEPPNDLEKGNLVVSNRGTLFGTCIGNQAFQQFQSTPACPELEVYVYDEKYLSEHEVISIVELKANLSGEAEFFGAEVIFSHEVLTDTIVSDDLVKFEQGTNQRHLRLTFMADKLKGQTSTLKAKYKPIFSETLCIYDATCYKTQEEMDQASSLSTLGGTFDPSQSLMRAESVVNYTCGGSSAFEGSTDDVTISSIASTCQLDGTWDNPLVNEGLPKCKWVSCNVPVGAEHNLNASEWNGEPIPFYTQLNYFCPNGGKFKESFELESQNATCLPENKWSTPSEWLECSKEAQCPKPPAEPTNGEVVVLHGGRIYNDQHGEPFDLDAGELGMANFNWTETVYLSTLVIHSAKLEIKDHKSDFHAFLIFSSDASPADVFAKSEAGTMALKTTSAPNILSLHKTESKENVSTVVIELTLNQKIQKTTPGRVLVLDPIIELVKLVGQACSGAEDCDKKQNDFNLFEHFQPTHHAAHLNYKCPLAFWFEPKNVTEQEITCNWNRTWSDSIPECVPYGCAHPPKPDATLNITMDTFPEDKVFDFGANVT